MVRVSLSRFDAIELGYEFYNAIAVVQWLQLYNHELRRTIVLERCPGFEVYRLPAVPIRVIPVEHPRRNH